MIITMIVAHCTDSTQFLSNFTYYSAMLEHTYYSQNYASIIGQGLDYMKFEIGSFKFNKRKKI